MKSLTSYFETENLEWWSSVENRPAQLGEQKRGGNLKKDSCQVSHTFSTFKAGSPGVRENALTFADINQI